MVEICLHKNPEWLKSQVLAGHTCQEISQLSGSTVNSVITFQRKYSLTRKALGLTKRPSKHFNFDKSQIEVIEGCLLSDASVGPATKTGLSAAFLLASNNENFVNQVSNSLLGHVKQCARIKDGRSNKTYPTLQIHGLDFVSMRKRWYPTGIKRIPFDLFLTPEVLKWWYIGDGALSRFQSKYSLDIRMYLCTDSFSHECNTLLCQKLIDIGITSSLAKNNRIYISRKHQAKFLELIGEPFPGYEHKWRIQKDGYGYAI